METLIKDVRFGIRVLVKNPLFTVIAIVTLGLGIGANTAIFSVVNAVILRPLPYRNAGRIVAIEELDPEGKRRQVTPANFLDWRAQNTVFEHLAAILIHTANLAGTAEAERINLAMTSANFFDVFSIQPQRGRLFMAEDEQAGHPAVVVISYSLWQRRFGGDAEIVGKPLTLDGNSYTIIGVAPENFQYPDKTEAWLPPFRLVPAVRESMDVTQVRDYGFLSAVALLKPNVPLARAKEEMEIITTRLRQQYPEANNNRFDRVVSLHTHLVGDTSNVLLLLLGAVGFVLLIACANVANLLLARAAARQKEIAVRTALGGSRFRIMFQLLTESALLALGGGAIGVLLAWWGSDLLTKLLPKDFPRLQGISLDYLVLGFTLLLSLITGMIFGFAPAWQISKTDVHESLKENSRGTIGGTRRNRLRNLLVITEVALSIILLIGAGLLFRSFLQLQAVNTGFTSQQVLTMSLTPSGTNFRTDPQYSAYYSQVAQKISEIAGVDSVGVISELPLSRGGESTAIRVEGRPLLPVDQWPEVNYRSVSADYFRALNIPILQGRALTQHDNESAPLVILINQAAAEQDFTGENPVGKRVTMGDTDSKNQPIWFEIVGVVANTRSIELNTEPAPEIYTSLLQNPFPRMFYVIRTVVEPTSVAAAVRQAAQEVDRAQPISDMRTLDNIVSDAVTQPRFNVTLLTIFGCIALLLSAAGIYGVISYSVTQRTHEIGIRMALGAQSRDVLKMVIGQGLRLIAVGMGIGLFASFFLTRVLSTLVFSISVTDPLTFASAPLILAVVAIMACYVPARRAAKIDPMIALRYE